MLRNYFISAIRALRRQPYFSLVNIVGLSTGISISLLLFIFIRHELSYDQFHEKKDRIHRVISGYTTNNGRVIKTAISFGTLAPKTVEDIAGVEDAVRLLRGGNVDLVHNQNNFLGKTLILSDYSFFNVFSFKSLLAGNFNANAFNNGGLVMSEETALEIFGKIPLSPEEVIINGKTYPLLDVIEIPKTSHLQFDVLIAGETDSEWDLIAYDSGLEFWTYLLYAEGVDAESTGEQVLDIYDSEMSQRFSSFTSSIHNSLQPLTEIHLYSEDISTSPERGSIETIRILVVIDLLILLIAVFNFINLSTVSYEKRIKEIGVRKVLGAFRGNLISQFLTESVFVTILSFAFALFLIQALIEPLGEALTINAEVTYWNSFPTLLILFSAAIALGLITGLYPALLISSFSPNRILRKQVFHSKGKSRVTSLMVGFQFVIAIVLLINLGYFKTQIQFMKSSNPGFNQDHVIVIDNLNDIHKEQLLTIENGLKQLPQVENFSMAQSMPGGGASGQIAYLDGQDPNSAMAISEIRTQTGFLETFEIPLVAGRDFNPDLATDKEAFILNEEAIKKLFPEGGDPINQSIVVGNRKGPIIGIMKDFHNASLKYQIEPLMISMDTPYRVLLSVKTKGTDIPETLAGLEKTLTEIDPNYSMSHFFLDERLESQYRTEKRSIQLISWSSIIASMLSLVGLLALTSFSIAKRSKEIAVRKVLGAKLTNLNWVLSKGFFLTILIANLVAVPLGSWLSSQWLREYAYRISMAQSWFILPVAIIISIFIPSLLISIETIRKARENPASVLNPE